MVKEYTVADVQIIDETIGICPACGEKKNLGPGGATNLIKVHLGSKICQNAQKKRDRDKTHQSSITNFLRKKPTLVPTTTSAPLPILASTSHLGTNSGIVKPPSQSSTHVTPVPAFLSSLNALITQLPESIPEATNNDVIAIAFGGPPANRLFGELVDASTDVLWEELVNPQLHSVFWNCTDSDLKRLVRRGEMGVEAFSKFVTFFVGEKRLAEALFGEQVHRLTNVIRSILHDEGIVVPNTPASQSVASPQAVEFFPDGTTPVPMSVVSEPIDVDALPDVLPDAKPQGHCCGFQLVIPEGRNAYTDYPFLLHNEQSLPWEVDGITQGGRAMVLRAHACKKTVKEDIKTCQQCRQLERGGFLPGIVKRIVDGVHENTPLAYYGAGRLVEVVRRKDRQIQGLRFGKLNAAKRLHGVISVLSDSKRLLVAISSGDVKNPDRILRRGLKHDRSIRTILGMYFDAAKGIYKPRDDREETMLQGILLWRLGGIRVAEFGHRALGLPGMSTLRAHSKMPPILVSPSTPQISEILQNLDACLSSGLLDVLKNLQGTTHIILMLDEIAVEKRIRWDGKTNQFVGLCREHGKNTNLYFENEKDIDMLFESLEQDVEQGGVHYASEATVAALGILNESKRVYSARPILISGTCKREQALEHAELMNILIKAIRHKMDEVAIKSKVISVASDGETRRGRALSMLTLKESLPSTSPIFPLLSPLMFINLQVGDEALVSDKDYRHIFKRLRNLLLRQRGIIIFGQFVSTSVLRKHLSDAGSSKTHLDAIFAPEDKQDVELAYNLLHDTWSLPSAPSENRPGYQEARNAIQTLGKLFKFLLLPYVCLSFSLSEQLEHLSAAAWLAFFLYRDAEKAFLPTLLYTDIEIMIKNIYFCVAQAKVDNPDSKFYIILLGTDRLEGLFGIIRSMIGNDSGCDLYQLAMRITGSTEVANILAQYPHWDKKPRRLKLPALDKDGNRISLPDNSDHINPMSWRGDINTKNVNLQTCWKAGLSRLQNDTEIRPVIQEQFCKVVEASRTSAIDMLHPFGKDPLSFTVDEDLEDVDDESPSASAVDQVIANRLDGAGFSVEFEDAAAEEDVDEVKSFDTRITYNGKVIHKAHALALRSKYKTKASSTDRLKRYQNISRFNSSLVTTPDSEATADGEVLMLNDPIASVLRSDSHLFLCIGEILSIHIDSKTVEQVSVGQLNDKITSVTFQLLFLVPTTVEDDPDKRHDWRPKRGIASVQFTAPGRLILPLNPSTGISATGKLQFLFESSILCSVAAALLDILSLQDAKSINTFRNEYFPYREANTGKACFAIESDTNEELPIHNVCPSCVPPVPLAQNRHQQLAHLAAHILFGSIDRSTEPCGACLSPWPLCQYYIGPKGKGAKRTIQITKVKNCKNPLPTRGFKYSLALTSSMTAPTTNIPIHCPLCTFDDPAIWRYNLHAHILRYHPDASLTDFEHLWDIGIAEQKRMKQVWDKRKDIPKPRNSKKKIPPLKISDAHTSRLALRSNDLVNSVEDKQEDDEPNDLAKKIGAMTNSGDNDDADFVVMDGEVDDGETEVDDEESAEESDGSQHDDSAENEDDDAIGYEAKSHIFDSIAESVRQEFSTLPASPHKSSETTSIILDSVQPHSREETEPVTMTRAENRMKTRKRGKKEVERAFECICGQEVSVEDRDDREVVAKCHASGCETIWYHLSCIDDMEDFDKPNWKCEACSSVARRPKKRLRDK